MVDLVCPAYNSGNMHIAIENRDFSRPILTRVIGHYVFFAESFLFSHATR